MICDAGRKIPLLAAAAFVCLAGMAFSASLPVPQYLWDRDYVPGVDGDPARTMWPGESWNDSVHSTGATALHELGITGSGVSAAVYDSMFDAAHERLKDNIVAAVGITITNDDPAQEWHSVQGTLNPDGSYTGDLAGYSLISSYVNNGVNHQVWVKEGLDAVQLPSAIPDPRGMNNHGTHVAGTVLGMAPDAGLVLLGGASVYKLKQTDPEAGLAANDWRVMTLLGEGLFPTVTAELAEQYNIVAYNGSYGYPGLGFPADQAGQDASAALYPDSAAALARLREIGVIPVICSQNYAWNNLVSNPAANADTVAVGALHPWGLISSFTNLSAKVALLAPGQNIYSSIPSWTIDQSTGIYGYGMMNGTSMAAPHVTGAIVLLKSGARNAGSEEILNALLVTADPVVYDPDVMTSLAFLDDWPDGADTPDRTMAELREYITTMDGYDPDVYSTPVEHVDYRFIRVDKAYRYLASTRSLGLMAQSMAAGDPNAAMLGSFALQLATLLDQDLVDLYQRLDGQDSRALARAARQMSPLFSNSALQSASFGVLGLHRLLGRRLERERAWPAGEDAFAGPTLCPPSGVSVWFEGFGDYINRSESSAVGDYDGHFLGLAAGVERVFGDGTRLGGFAAAANHRISGDDGRARGNWGNLGLYGGAERNGLTCDFSFAGGIGDYDLRRNVFGPAAVFPGYAYQPILVKSDADARTLAFGGRLAVGYDIERGRWRFGPAAEGSFSFMRMGSYGERGTGALALSVDSHRHAYAEAGGGLRATALFRPGGRPLAASLKMLAVYGRERANAMRGAFSVGGTPFAAVPERLSGWWFLPEVGISWRAGKRTTVGISYQGRFGEKTRAHSGNVSIAFDW